MAERKLYAVGTEERGNEFVTAMLSNIHSVNSALRKESLFRWMRFIIRNHCRKVVLMTEAI